MPRSTLLVPVNILSLGLIAGILFWALRLPAPTANVGDTGAPPSGGIRSVAADVTLAMPVNVPTAGTQPTVPQPASGQGVEFMSTDKEGTAASSPHTSVESGWLERISARTQIPSQALQAYSAAAIAAKAAAPACGIGWNTLAAIGLVESAHGTYGGDSPGELSHSRPRIVGPRLDGKGFASIPDTDGGRLDGDSVWDRAVGPMQFIPSTWATAGLDGNGDGVADPFNIYDAAMSAGSYLCGAGRNLRTASGWTEAVMSYNQSSEYLRHVRDQANAYAELADGTG